ncbi:hypothetical protein CCZ01_06640 [Helicobacter monodelphidis]|uniref:50S ribosomal protein L11 methyltransferase n=1 Tax=Helicobacter sp. 15-1451 TaxID=2004995 RepID=UPI000DCF5114|nr:50S ribosomal protein L11 methyltransferase [Helicobacter sp. 15-1451]RAX57250.1 hypothetical protein CCZ01_06640 [Helicobacter sp. 15-1451]
MRVNCLKEFYYKLLVIPSSVAELFADFLLEYTGEAIEEICYEQKEAFVVYSENNLQPLIDALQEFVQRLNAMGCHEEEVTCRYLLSSEKQQDWISQYQQGVSPVECGDFYVRPSWYPPHSCSLDEIVIDPALAFGSGHHETTSSCLEILSECDLENRTILDVGCGSGILSIAAMKKGAIVSACDTDMLAYEESQKNFQINNVKAQELWHGSLNDSKVIYDFILANLVSTVIIALALEFKKHTKKGSKLLLSGILGNARTNVLECFRDFSIQKELVKQEWLTLLLCKN